jgi:hypothetical protein
MREVTCFKALFNVKIISQVIGTVQGTLTPWFRSIRSEEVTTFLAFALGTLTSRAALGTLAPSVFRAAIYALRDKM